MNIEMIEENVSHILEMLPSGVTLVAAEKSRTLEEMESAIRAGVTCLGHNYVQEAEQIIPAIGHGVQWHMIGHLQRNKAKMVVQLFEL